MIKISNKFFLSLVFLSGILTCLFAQTPINAENPFTHELSSDEAALMPFWSENRTPSTPPLSPVRPVAEFEPLTAVLIRYPLGIPVNLVKQMAQELTVITIVGSETVKNQAISAYNSAQVNMNNCKFMIGATNSYWTRDFGPWFSMDANNQLSVIDFTYNRPRPLDDALIPIYAQYDTLSCYTMTITQTGGNYMTDGISQAVSSHIAYTENNNNSTTVNQQMLNYLGVSNYHVVQDPNDTYIDHVDCWGKLLAPDKILIRSVPASHPRYQALENMANYFSTQMSSYNRPYRVYRVNTPDNQPYSNSVILNNRVFVPIMNSSYDQAALQAYRNAMPGYTVIGVLGASATPWESTDALHCRTHEIPDRRMIYIAHTPLNFQQDFQDSYQITAKIQPLSGGTLIADSTKLYVRVNSSDFTAFNLSETSDDNYTASIPAAAPGDTIFYYIHAVDTMGKKVNHPLIGAPDPHYFVISNVSDTTAPVITHQVVENVSMNDFPLTIIANVTDNVMVDSVYFDFYTNTLSEVQSLPMTLGSENNWTLAFSPSLNCLTTVNYRIRALDTANPANVSYLPSQTEWYTMNITNPNSDLITVPAKDKFISVYPNPINFNQSDISLKFSTDENKEVNFDIFNIKGQKVASIKQHSQKNNTNSVQFNLNDNLKNRLNSGIYFIKMTTNHTTITKKIAVIK